MISPGMRSAAQNVCEQGYLDDEAAYGLGSRTNQSRVAEEKRSGPVAFLSEKKRICLGHCLDRSGNDKFDTDAKPR
jgi:hypothetical protein